MIDPTVMAALAGVIGAIIGAVLGGVFALKAAKRQVEVMLRQSRGDVNERLYNQSLEIMTPYSRPRKRGQYRRRDGSARSSLAITLHRDNAATGTVALQSDPVATAPGTDFTHVLNRA